MQPDVAPHLAITQSPHGDPRLDFTHLAGPAESRSKETLCRPADMLIARAYDLAPAARPGEVPNSHRAHRLLGPRN